MKLIIIGGSREAQRLAAHVPGADLIDGESLPEQFDADAVIDASHPCEQRTPSVVAARIGTTPLLRLRRPAWQAEAGDNWMIAADAQAACDALRPEWTRVFLCLGADDRAPFAVDSSRWYLVRTRAVDAAHPPRHVIAEKAGPFSVEDERSTMAKHGISVLVTRNAGGQGAIPKVLGARALGLPVVMLARPPALSPEVATIEEALAWLDTCAG